MKVKLNHLMESNSCIKVDDDLTSNIAKVIENTRVLQGDEFKHIFWEQQVAGWFISLLLLSYVLISEMVAGSSKHSKENWCTLASFVY